MAILGVAAAGCVQHQGLLLGLAGRRIATLGDAAAEHVSLVAQPLDGQPQFEPQLGKIGAAEVAEFDVLEIVPDPLVGIEVRGVAGQLLQLEPRRRSLGKEVLDRLSAMNRRPIPNHQQLARNLAQQMLQKADDLRAAKRPLPHLQEEPTVVGEAADDGEMVTSTADPQDGRLAPWRVGAHQARQEIEAGLIYPDDRSPLALGFA